ncbi:MAG: hypothetical protein R3Y24_02805 [Eubacteriales bacterium]
MNYYLLESDPLYKEMPYIKSLSKDFDLNNIRSAQSHKLPDISIAYIYENPDTNFIDIVSSPFLLCSDLCMKVIKIYEPYIISKKISLLDTTNKIMRTYDLPILPRLNCLTENSEFNLDKSVIKYAELDLIKVKHHSIFHIADAKNMYTVIRLDMLESMLKRGAKGLSITKLDTRSGGIKNE